MQHTHTHTHFNIILYFSLTLQELSPTSDANLTHSLMNIHESLLDEFKEESKLTQLALTDEQKEAWIMVSTLLFIREVVLFEGIAEVLYWCLIKGIRRYMYMYT